MVIHIDDNSVPELKAALEAGARDCRKAADRRVLRSLLEHVQAAPAAVDGWTKVGVDALRAARVVTDAEAEALLLSEAEREALPRLDAESSSEELVLVEGTAGDGEIILDPDSSVIGALREVLSLDSLILMAVDDGATKTELVRSIGALEDFTHAEADARFDGLKASGLIVDGEARGKYAVDWSKTGEIIPDSVVAPPSGR